MISHKNYLQKLFCIVCLVASWCNNSYSQWIIPSSVAETSVYAAAGITKLQGDMGGYVYEKFPLIDSNTSFAAGFRLTTPYRIGISILSEVQNHYQGDDSGTHLAYRQMGFKSRQYGYSAQLEITLLGGNYMKNYMPHTIYTFGGGGYCFSKTKFVDDSFVRSNDMVKLDEQAALIFGGFGYQYRLTKNLALGAEYRATQFFSDYIDGYHPYFSKRDDMSMDLRVTVAYFFNLNIGGKKIWDCNCEY